MKKKYCLLLFLFFSICAYPATSHNTSANLPDNNLSLLTAEKIFGEVISLEAPEILNIDSISVNISTSEEPCGIEESIVILNNIDYPTNLASTGEITFLPATSKRQLVRHDFFHSTVSRFIIPAGLITYGVVAQNNPLLQRWDDGIKAEAYKLFPGRTYVDDWIQYAPVVGLFTLKLTGVKSENTWLNMTIAAATSYIFTTAFVRTIKAAVHKMRPDGSADNSFPSGHTATAFAGAHLLYKEYRDVSPWIGIAGYTVATATGFMRIMNRRHWFSDVAAGAGIGILSVELGYLLLPLFDRWIGGNGKNSENIAFSPVSYGNYTGMGILYMF